MLQPPAREEHPDGVVRLLRPLGLFNRHHFMRQYMGILEPPIVLALWGHAGAREHVLFGARTQDLLHQIGQEFVVGLSDVSERDENLG